MKRTPGDREQIERELAGVRCTCALDVLIAMERAFGIAEGHWQSGALAIFEDFATILAAQREHQRTRCRPRQALLTASVTLGTSAEAARKRISRETSKNGSGSS